MGDYGLKPETDPKLSVTLPRRLLKLFFVSASFPQPSTYHPSVLRSYYHDYVNADHENSRNRNH